MSSQQRTSLLTSVDFRWLAAVAHRGRLYSYCCSHNTGPGGSNYVWALVEV